MDELSDLCNKYAAGGPARPGVHRALAAVHGAMGHLQRGDHASALAALRSSPEASAHPEVAAVMAALQGGARPQVPAPAVLRRPAQPPQGLLPPQAPPVAQAMAQGGEVSLPEHTAKMATYLTTQLGMHPETAEFHAKACHGE